MIIQSKFKDYYDHVPHLYGGGDPKVIYSRNRLVPLSAEGISGSITINYETDRNLFPTRDYQCRYLCVVGKYYLIVMDPDYTWSLFNPVRHTEIAKILLYNPRSVNKKQLDYYTGFMDQNLVDLSHRMGTPVFIIKGLTPYKDYVVIDAEIPILKNIVGFAAQYPPEQLYQDLACFMSPPEPTLVEIGDRDKINQYGFDLRQSFRHRK